MGGMKVFGVILAVGLLFGTYLAFLFQDDWIMAIPMALIGMAFLGMAWVGARLAARYGDEPGAASFDTRNPDER